MEGAGMMVVTDIGVLSKRDKAGSDYTVIENTQDGKRANFKLGFTTRYICYIKRRVSQSRGFAVIAEMKVVPLRDKAPEGFLSLLQTMDDKSKSFQSRQLLVRFVAVEDATEAISDIIVLSNQCKEEVPANYQRLPEINGFSICYKICPVRRKSGSQVNNRQLSSQGRAAGRMAHQQQAIPSNQQQSTPSSRSRAGRMAPQPPNNHSRVGSNQQRSIPSQRYIQQQSIPSVIPNQGRADGSVKAMRRDSRPMLHQIELLKIGSTRKRIIEELGVDWEALAYRLEFDHTVIGTIKENNSGKGKRMEMSCRDMLSRWLNGEACQPVTWGRLVEAIRDIPRDRLATEIERLLP